MASIEPNVEVVTALMEDYDVMAATPVDGEEVIDTPLKTKDRHKRVSCDVCVHEMLSNNLKRHMKAHTVLTNETVEGLDTLLDSTMDDPTLSVGEELTVAPALLLVNAELAGVGITIKVAPVKDYRKRVICTACGKEMLNNHLKRHMKTHADLTEMNETQTREEIRKRKLVTDERESQRQIFKRIAQEEGASFACYEQSLPALPIIGCDSLECRLLWATAQYMESVEEGFQIFKFISDGVAREEAWRENTRKP